MTTMRGWPARLRQPCVRGALRTCLCYLEVSGDGQDSLRSRVGGVRAESKGCVSWRLERAGYSALSSLLFVTGKITDPILAGGH